MQAMATNRIDILKEMVAADPANSFARYGLAMEYAKAGELMTSVNEYRQLMALDADYPAAYFHCGQALEKLGEVAQARAVYEQGMAASDRKGDGHTRAEIEAALNLLPA